MKQGGAACYVVRQMDGYEKFLCVNVSLSLSTDIYTDSTYPNSSICQPSISKLGIDEVSRRGYVNENPGFPASQLASSSDADAIESCFILKFPT